MIDILGRKKDNLKCYSLASYFILQYNMIARIDDVAHVFLSMLRVSSQFPFALVQRLPWSKNMCEERDAPFQILIGASDPTFCVILALAIHLETWAVNVAPDVDFLFAICDNPRNSKDYAGRVLRDEVLGDDKFTKEIDGRLGSHSIRKLGSTQAARSSCSSDEISIRGRWKIGGKQQVHTYIDLTLPYPDGKVAGELSIGGTIKYVFREGSGLSDEWVNENVTPNIHTLFGRNKVSAVLGKALL